MTDIFNISLKCVALFWAATACVANEGRMSESGLASLTGAMSEGGPGCAYVVKHGDKIIEQGAGGFADIENKKPLSSQMLFDIGSVSKSFSAAAIFDLDRRGLLSLDEAISTYIAGLPSWGDKITVADLVYMRSGMPNFPVGDPDIVGWKDEKLTGTDLTMSDSVSVNDIFNAIRSMETLKFEPGTVYDYSNSNYMLLREIAEAVTGKPFSTLIMNTAERISGIHVRVSEFRNGRRLSPSQALGYDVDETAGAVPFLADWDVLGASSVWLSINGLADWGRGLIADTETFALRSKPGIMDFPDGRDGRGYAFGLMTITIDGEQIVYHPGGTEGFSSGLFLRPARGEVLAFSCNMSPDLLFATGLESAAKDQLAEHKELVFLMAWLAQGQ